MPSLRCLRRPRCRRGSGKSIRYDADHDQDRTREGDQVHVLSAPFNQPSNAYGQYNSGRREHGRLLIRSYAATATMISVPQVPGAGASALVRAKHRGHVACPQASLSNRSTAPRPGREGCATRPQSRQEQGTGRHAPTRRRQCCDRRLPYRPAKRRPEIARASIVLPRPVSRAACPSESVVM
jgi:hypothetical protein